MAENENLAKMGPAGTCRAWMLPNVSLQLAIFLFQMTSAFYEGGVFICDLLLHLMTLLFHI